MSGLIFLYPSNPYPYSNSRVILFIFLNRFAPERLPDNFCLITFYNWNPPPPPPPRPTVAFLIVLILIGPTPLSNYFLELTFLTAAILMLFSSFSSSILFLIILSELIWLLFFCFTHAVLKAFAIQAVLLIFIFFLAIATLDLAYALTLCFFFGKVFGVTSTCFTHAAVSNFNSSDKGGLPKFLHKL